MNSADYGGCYHPISPILIKKDWSFRSYRIGYDLIKYDCKLNIWRNTSHLILQILKFDITKEPPYSETQDPGIILLDDYQLESAIETISSYPRISDQPKEELIEVFERIEKLRYLE